MTELRRHDSIPAASGKSLMSPLIIRHAFRQFLKIRFLDRISTFFTSPCPAASSRNRGHIERFFRLGNDFRDTKNLASKEQYRHHGCAKQARYESLSKFSVVNIFWANE